MKLAVAPRYTCCIDSAIEDVLITCDTQHLYGEHIRIQSLAFQTSLVVQMEYFFAASS